MAEDALGGPVDRQPGVEVEYRRLSGRQRAELRGYVAASTAAFRALLFLLAVGVVGLGLRALFRAAASVLPVLSHPAWWIAPSCLLAWHLYRKSGRWTGGSAFRAQVRRDLAAGRLAIRRIDVVDAVEFEEVGDCGPCYVLLTTQAGPLLFDGQYLGPYQRRGFPWTSFEIREAPESGVFFGLRRLGERLPPPVRLPAMSFPERKALGSFNRSYQPVAVDFAALVARGHASQAAGEGRAAHGG